MVQTGEITDKQSIYVLPERAEVTHSPHGRVWASYGEYDRLQLQKQCRELQVKYSFGETHVNIKSLFSLKMKFTKGKGLVKALKILKEPPEGTHHNGADDAYNAARVLRHTLFGK